MGARWIAFVLFTVGVLGLEGPDLTAVSDMNADGQAVCSQRPFASGDTDQILLVAAGDFNGDGKTDVLLAHRGTGPLDSWGNSFDMCLSAPGADYGLTLATWLSPIPAKLISGGGVTSDYRVLTGDFNGDGKMDVAFLRRPSVLGGAWSGIEMALGTGAGFTYETWGSMLPTRMFDVALGNGVALAVGDFNGDGKSDIAATTIPRVDDLVPSFDWNRFIFLQLSTGASFASASWLARIPAHLYMAHGAIRDFFITAADFNGDGKSDLVAVLVTPDTANSTQFARRLRGGWLHNAFLEISDGAMFRSDGWITVVPEYCAATNVVPGDIQYLVGDVNGDGKDDLVAVDRRADFAGGIGWTARQLFVEMSTGFRFHSYRWAWHDVAAGAAAALTHSLQGDSTTVNFAVQLADLNGDGTLDFLGVPTTDVLQYVIGANAWYYHTCLGGVLDACTCDGACFIDMCRRNNGDCGAHSACSSVAEAVTCGVCDVGFSRAGGPPNDCLDVNECATLNGGCPQPATACNNTAGTSACYDVNSCATANGGCDAVSTLCINVVMANDRCACRAGFENLTTTWCADINECLVNNGGCASIVNGGNCTNVPGARTCSCLPGYDPLVDGC